jgi:hypothetical protein
VSKSTILAKAQLNHSPHNVLTIELGERDGSAAIVKITWPFHPTMCDPNRFPELAATAARLFATAATELASIKARRRL